MDFLPRRREVGGSFAFAPDWTLGNGSVTVHSRLTPMSTTFEISLSKCDIASWPNSGRTNSSRLCSWRRMSSQCGATTVEEVHERLLIPVCD